MQAVLDDWTTADVPERTRAGLRLLEAMTKHPQDIDAAFVTGLRADGLDDEAIGEAASVAFHFNLINRIADAFDFPLLDAETKAKQAKMLNTAGRLLRGSKRTGQWREGDDGRVRPLEIHLGRERMLSTEGCTAPELRRDIEAFVRTQWDESLPTAELPPELVGYMSKLARNAYRITDEDVESLREAGYDDDRLYEVTVVGAFTSALIGLEHLYAALHGELSAAA